MKGLSTSILVTLTIAGIYIMHTRLHLERTSIWFFEYGLTIIILLIVGLNFTKLSETIQNFLNHFKDEN